MVPLASSLRLVWNPMRCSCASRRDPSGGRDQGILGSLPMVAHVGIARDESEGGIHPGPLGGRIFWSSPTLLQEAKRTDGFASHADPTATSLNISESVGHEPAIRLPC